MMHRINQRFTLIFANYCYHANESNESFTRRNPIKPNITLSSFDALNNYNIEGFILNTMLIKLKSKIEDFDGSTET